MKNPGNYTLKQFLLMPLYGDVEPVDITNLVPTFEIIESIRNDSLRGSALVLDSAGVLENLPIRGEEKILIHVEDWLGLSHIYHMFLYKVDNIQASTQERSVSYTIYFTSFQRWWAGRHRIVQAFDMSPALIVKKIFDDYYKPRDNNFRTNGGAFKTANKELDYEGEKLETSISVTIPNMTPMAAIKFIVNRTYSVDVSGTSTFRFYESADRFVFGPDEAAYKKAKDRPETIKKFTYGYIDRHPDKIADQEYNFTSLKQVSTFDSASEQANGSYASKAYIMDLNRGELKYYDYSWAEAKKMVYHNSPGKLQERHSQQFIDDYFMQPNQLNFYIVQMYDIDNPGSFMGNQHYPEIAATRTGYSRQLESLTVMSEGPGRLDVTCGDVIDVSVKEYIANETTVEENKQASGEYIVDTVRKSFDKDTMTNNYTLIKKGFRK